MNVGRETIQGRSPEAIQPLEFRDRREDTEKEWGRSRTSRMWVLVAWLVKKIFQEKSSTWTNSAFQGLSKMTEN